MATFKAANTSFSIPGGGEIFIPTQPRGITPTVYARSGDVVRVLNLESLVPRYACGRSNGFSCFRDADGNEVQVNSAGQVWEEAVRRFKDETGLDYYSLPQQNIADVQGAFGRGSLSTLPNQLRTFEGSNALNDFKSFIGDLQPGGDVDISQGQTVNAQGQLVDASGKVLGSAVNPNQGIETRVDVPQAPTGVNTSAQTIQPSVLATLPNLAPGDRGDNVKTLQAFLVGMGYNIPDGITGYFGEQTKAALAAYQAANSIDTAGNPGYFGPRTKSYIQSAGSGTPAPDGTGVGTPPTGSEVGPLDPNPDVTYQEDINLDEILANSGLSADQQDMVRSIYNTISVNDEQNAARIAASITQAMEFSNPYFKAQARIVLDELERGIKAEEESLAAQESRLARQLQDLEADVSVGLGNLSFDEARAIKDLERSYKTTLDTTRQNLAQSGFTSSSRRAREEQILDEATGELRESTTRSFGEQRRNLEESLSRGARDTTAEIERLRNLTQTGKLDLFRKAEQILGSGNLPTLPGIAPIGGIAGSLTRDQARDALAFSGGSFVF